MTKEDAFKIALEAFDWLDGDELTVDREIWCMEVFEISKEDVARYACKTGYGGKIQAKIFFDNDYGWKECVVNEDGTCMDDDMVDTDNYSGWRAEFRLLREFQTELYQKTEETWVDPYLSWVN